MRLPFCLTTGVTATVALGCLVFVLGHSNLGLMFLKTNPNDSKRGDFNSLKPIKQTETNNLTQLAPKIQIMLYYQIKIFGLKRKSGIKMNNYSYFFIC